MNSNVISLDESRPHKAKYVACMRCGKDHVAVYPASARIALECSACGAMACEVVAPDDLGWLNRFMAGARNKAECKQRTMVVLNAHRMGIS